MATETSCQVLIIGAGISGISAAQKLQENDISDYLILEATDRVGGRIKTLAKTEDGYDYVLELGAGWIHGVNGNPVFQIAKQNKLLSQKGLKVKTDPRLVNCERQYRTPDGENVSPAIFEPVNRAYAKKFGEGETYYENGLPNGIEKDMGFGDYLYETVMNQMTEKDEKKRKLMSDVLRSRLMYETTLSGCDDMNEVSLKYIGSYTELSGGHVVLPKGYETVIDTLRTNIKKSNIILNCPVKNIKYYINGDGKCEVICSNGRTFFADYVIVTTSVGFLKENAADLFTPSLSIEKLKAIENIGFGTVDRIYSEFENLDFIPEPEVGELYLTKPEKNSTEGTGWQEKLFTFYIQNTPRANVLTAWISGHQAEAMEKSSDEEIKRKVRDILQKHLGVEVPLPKNIIKSDWHSNPYFRGSYSFVKLGASVRDIQLLAEPIVNKSSQKPVILFAGEATSENFYSTTHGALLSGQREAQRILKFIQQ